MGLEQLASLKAELRKPTEMLSISQPAQVDASSPNLQSRSVDPVLQTIAALQKHFPKAFPRKPAPKVPLTVGILADVQAHAPALGVSEGDVRKALKVWCSGSRYWTGLVEGAARVDLQGEGRGLVSGDDASRALKMESNRLAKARPKPPVDQTNS